MGVNGQFFKGFYLIKPEDSKNLTENPKLDKQTSDLPKL